MLLAGCSKVCTTEPAPGSDDVTVFARRLYDEDWSAANEEKLSQCTVHSEYAYSEGNILGSILGWFVANQKPDCLRRKAVNDAVATQGLWVVEHRFMHFESGLNYFVATYDCPPGTQFTQDLAPR